MHGNLIVTWKLPNILTGLSSTAVRSGEASTSPLERRGRNKSIMGGQETASQLGSFWLTHVTKYMVDATI